MHQHPYFDLWLHEDHELADLLGAPLLERAAVHEWPLSYVQRIRTADGRTLIYKAQAPPTVEPSFYAAAASPALPRAQILPHPHGPPALLLDDIDAPRLQHQRLSQAEAISATREALQLVAGIRGELPALADIRGEERWAAYAAEALADLAALVETGAARHVSHATVARIARAAESRPVLEAVRSEPGYLHADLRGDNILAAADGLRIIDWQRPLRGPVALDQASLLESLGVDPARHVPESILQLRTLLLIAWFAQAARRWFPPGTPWYDTEIARLAAGLGAQ